MPRHDRPVPWAFEVTAHRITICEEELNAVCRDLEIASYLGFREAQGDDGEGFPKENSRITGHGAYSALSIKRTGCPGNQHISS